MSSYFSLPSFARAKQNKEQLEKTNPKSPVLTEEDENFLSKQISSTEAQDKLKDAESTKITDDGEEKELSKEETQKEGTTSADQVAVPEVQPPTVESKEETETANTSEPAAKTTEEAASAEDPPEQAPVDSAAQSASPTAAAKKPKKNKGFELPSQEEAEAATRSFNASEPPKDASGQGQQSDKRTWASYLPSIGTGAKSDAGVKKDGNSKTSETKATDEKSGDQPAEGQQRTWAEYASSAYSSLPSIASMTPARKPKDTDSKIEPVYKEDGTIDEEKTKEKQEREMSVLLDRLNMSSINNRVFAFSGETQKIYERFAQVLRDTMNGAPTAYEDMDKLMKDAGPELEKQFQSMPPFVQTLVKSLPAKLGTTLGPELLAAASEKPGADMQTRMKNASKQPSSEPSLQTAESSKSEKDGEQKKTRKIPGLKGLVSSQGAVASTLRSIVTFITTRFPFLASTTNVVMSLAVFILMFVFWYSHKRGKEVRLAREASAKNGDGAPDIVEDEDGELEVEVTDEEEDDDDDAAEPESIEKQTDSAEAVEEKAAHTSTDDKAAPDATEPASIEKQSDSAEAVQEKASKTTTHDEKST